MDYRSGPDIPGVAQPGNVTKDVRSVVCRLLNSPKPMKVFPGSQPVSFQHSDIRDKLLEQDYYVCEKTDGLRLLMLVIVNGITGEQGCFMIDRENNFYLVSGFRFPRLPSRKKEELLETLQDGTLIDGELVVQTNPATKIQELRYLMFDCLAINGRCLIQSPTSSRLAHLGKEFFKPYYDLRSYYPDKCTTFPFKLSMKHMDFSYDLVKVSQSLSKLPHKSDGLIFTPVKMPYQIGTKDSFLLKWKPEQENSVDFKLILDIPMVEDTSLPRKDPHRWYYNYDVKPIFNLYVWLGGADVNPRLKNFDEPFDAGEMEIVEKTYRKFGELEVSDAKWQELKNLEQPLNGRIVECAKDPETGAWTMLRFRDDKLNGNHVSVVQKVLESIDDAVSLEDLGDIVPDIKMTWDERKLNARNAAAAQRNMYQHQGPPTSHAGQHMQHQHQDTTNEPRYVDEEDDWFD